MKIVVTIMARTAAVLFSVLFCVVVSLHRIKEGHVGVYFRGGALLQSTSTPGFHMMIPFFTVVRNIQVNEESYD